MMVHRCASVCWGVIGDDLLLWSQSDRRQHVLNSSAANVWFALETPMTIDEVVTDLGERYSAHPDSLRPDVETVIEHFLASGLCVEDAATSRVPTPIAANEPTIGEIDQRAIVGPIHALGLPLVVESDDVLLRNELARILDPLLDRGLSLDGLFQTGGQSVLHIHVGCTAGSWVVTSGGRVVGRAASRPQAVRMVLSEVNAAPLPNLVSSVVFHAAGVNMGEGVVLLPGVSNSGKSTLVAQLMSRGHGYLTDEAVSVDVESLRALPFHKSICLEGESQILLPQLAPSEGMTPTWDVDPRRIVEGWLAPADVVTAVVFPTFTRGAVTDLRPLEPVEAVQRLLGNAFDFSHVGQPAFSAITRIANGLPCYALTHAGGKSPLDVLENRFAVPTAVRA